MAAVGCRAAAAAGYAAGCWHRCRSAGGTPTLSSDRGCCHMRACLFAPSVPMHEHQHQQLCSLLGASPVCSGGSYAGSTCGSVHSRSVADAGAHSSVVGRSSSVVSSAGAYDGGGEFSGSPRLCGVRVLSCGPWFGGYVPAASQAGFTPAAAAAAAQPVQSLERTAGGLDQVSWSRSVGGPGPPCYTQR